MSTNFEISCKECAFCSDRCPMDIPIPLFFQLYNAYLRGEAPDGQDPRVRYEQVVKIKPRASDCLRCGQCEGFCPEHLPIMGFLQDIAEDFEEY